MLAQFDGLATLGRYLKITNTYEINISHFNIMRYMREFSFSFTERQQKYYKPNGPISLLKLKKTSKSQIVIKQLPILKNPRHASSWVAYMKSNKGLGHIGNSKYRLKNSSVDLDEIKQTAAKLGAAVAYVNQKNLGKSTQSVMVPVSQSSGRIVTSSSSGYSSSTYLSGSTTYGRRLVNVDNVEVAIAFFNKYSDIKPENLERYRAEVQRINNL